MALARVLESCQRERERDFFKFVAAVWDLRGRVQTHSPELTPSEAKRTMAMQEHVFAMVVAQRAALARMDDQLRTMTAWLESLVTMSDARFGRVAASVDCDIIADRVRRRSVAVHAAGERGRVAGSAFGCCALLRIPFVAEGRGRRPVW